MANRRTIDLRSPAERLSNPVEGAEPWSLERLKNSTEEFEDEAELCIVGSPEKSGEAAHVLAKLGFKNTTDRENGMLAWKGEYFPADATETNESDFLEEGSEKETMPEGPLSG